MATKRVQAAVIEFPHRNPVIKYYDEKHRRIVTASLAELSFDEEVEMLNDINYGQANDGKFENPNGDGGMDEAKRSLSSQGIVPDAFRHHEEEGRIAQQEAEKDLND